MSWQQVSLDVSSQRAEAFETALQAYGAVSVTLADAGDEPLLEPGPGESPLWSGVRLSALFPEDADLSGLSGWLQARLGGPEPETLRLATLADQSWERAWLDDFEPMPFGERLWIVPTGCQPPDPSAVNLHFDPGLAFGTGTHPTTALCLNWLAANPPAGKRVIDYGCGSGVLAVAALKLGAREAVGVDNDPQALVASAANARRNGVAERLELLGTDDERPAPASVVLANIVSGVLIERAGLLNSLVASGDGRLVLSGVLEHQVPDVAAAFDPDFEMLHQSGAEGWVRLDGRRR